MAKRRGHGEGSISLRKDGRYQARIDLGYVNGKRKRKYVYGKTRKDVAEQLKVLLYDQKTGAMIATERQTVAQFLDRWLEDVVKGTSRPLTYVNYETAVRLHLKPTLGRYALTKLTAQHVNAMVKAKTAEGLAPRTISRIRMILRVALQQAFKWQMIPRNVADAVPAPRSEHHDVRVMTQDEVLRFLAAIKGDRLETLFTLVLATGLRKGEALGLHWQDVDLEAGRLRVRVALQRVGDRIVYAPPKTESSKRTLMIPPPVVTLLRTWKIQQLEERLLAGANWHDEGLVFTTPIGLPIKDGQIRKNLHGALKLAQLPPMSIHGLRHIYASLMLAENVHAKVVQVLLGHSKITTTLDIYSHVLPATANDAAMLMGRLLVANE